MQEAALTSEQYDFREQFPACVEPVFAQRNCTASYAFAAAGVTSERFCASSGSQITVSLSAQDILSCDPKSHGCSGGEIDVVW
jgi:cathepsin B